jgi:agmatine deiminase
MAWAVHPEWGKAVNKVKRELSEVVQTIARYEPVRVLATHGEAKIVALDWNFNAWGGTADRRPRAGDCLARTAVAIFDVPRVPVSFIAEGGALLTDGRGTLVTTRSCLLNPNRNPARRRIDRQNMIEKELAKFDIRKTIWLEGDPSEPITSGHADGYVLCAPGGVVLVKAIDDKEVELPVWREHDVELLENACDANGRKLKVVRVLAPRKRYWKADLESFAPCYLNVYLANSVVIGARLPLPQ